MLNLRSSGYLLFLFSLLGRESLVRVYGLEYCERNSDCHFHSVCVDGTCLCNADCTRFGKFNVNMYYFQEVFEIFFIKIVVVLLAKL